MRVDILLIILTQHEMFISERIRYLEKRQWLYIRHCKLKSVLLA